MLNENLLSYIEERQEEAFSFLRELAQIPAPSGQERARAKFCKKWLEDAGAKGVYIDQALNMVYPVGVDKDNPVVIFAAHTDVVFSDSTRLPYREEKGRIYCPGIGDDSACVTALLMAARYVAERGLSPKNVGVLFVCDSGEEGLGNLKGTRELCRQYEGRIKRFYSFDCQLDEVITQAVGSQRYRVRMSTRGGHSLYDFGEPNAIAQMSRLVDRLYQVQVPEGGRTTYNVGMFSGGTSVNTIASGAEILYEFRSDCGESLDFMRERFWQLVEEAGKRPGVTVDCQVIGIRPCGKDVDEEERKCLERQVRRAVKSAIGREPVPKKASTDCNIFLSQGIPSVCVGSYFGAGCHTREEYVEKGSLKAGWKVALDLVMDFFIR